jgi:hypothetical protein
MAGTTTTSLRLSHDLKSAVEASFEDWGYAKLAGAGRGTLRYAVLARTHHTITAAWDRWSDSRQDVIDKALSIVASSGKPVRGSWLECILDRMAGESAPPQKADADLPLRLARELVKIACEIDPDWKPKTQL